MAVQLGEQSRIYSAKYVEQGGVEKIVDISASGNTDAQRQFEDQFPNCRLINIWRKQ